MSPYYAVAFLGSFLLFEIELLIAKLLLPHFGGSAHVWTACMMFFQATLLAGYFYARISTRLLSARRQAWLHLAVLASSAMVFPIAAAPPESGPPVLRLLMALSLAIGAPFLALSATVPIIQSWLSRTDRPEREHPYALYAASNTGALAALFAYPFLIEPLLSLGAQVLAWQVCYGLFAAAHLLCLPESDAPPPAAGRGRAAAVPKKQVLAWVALSAAPCAAMLAATYFLVMSLAAVPLLWVVPLAIYLSTFILNFKQTPWKPGPFGCALGALLALVSGPFLLVILGQYVLSQNVRIFAGLLALLGIVLNILALFIVAMICHRSLAESKPLEEDRAPTFYLAIAFGGLIGGAIMAVVAPLLGRNIGAIGFDWILAGFLSLAALVIRDWELWRSRNFLRPTTIVIGVFVGFLVLVALRSRDSDLEYALRNFYGIYKVQLDHDGAFRKLMHGNTLHGMQHTDPDKALVPLAYYHRRSPVGDVFRLFGAGLRDMGVVGLGAGCMTAYGHPEGRLTFYELDPDVEMIARTRFGFLSESKVPVRVLHGDARITLERSTDTRHDILVLDAFAGGAIPTHLLTREAFELYLARTAPGAPILCHISNRFLDLRPLLAAAAGSLGLHAVIRSAEPPAEEAREYYRCHWAVLTSDPEKARRLKESGWTDLSEHGSRWVRAWTDSYVSILPIFRF